MRIAIIGSGNVGKALAGAATRAGHHVTLSARSPELDGKVIIDVTNRVDMKDPGKTLDGSSMSEHIQKKVPNAHVVKAFNYVLAAKMADPKVNGKRLDGFVAGDDEPAKQKALQFVESIGFRPIDAGPLAMARALEGMASLNIILQVKNNWPWQNGWKLVGPPEED